MDAETETRHAAPWLAVGSLYLAGMLQGLTLVSFPASSAVLKQMHGFSDAQYGAIFLPQVALAVIGALGGGALASRLGLKTLLGGALLINALSQLLLAGSMLLPPALAFASVLLGTACLGLGFGVAGAPLNGLPPLFFPQRRDSALVALHTLLGLGLAIGPLVASPFIMSGRWAGFPLLLAALCALLAVSAFVQRFPEDGSERPPAPASGTAAMADLMPLPSGIQRTPGDEHPVRTAGFWLFMAIAVLYAFAEGTFGNWAVLYLQDVKHLPVTVAASALSVFWAAMVGGRLLTSVLVLKLAPRYIWLTLPGLMIVAFLLLPYADTPWRGIAGFALSGLACSAFFPLSIGLASQRFARHVPWVSSMLIAALMVGVGLGSYVIGVLRDAVAMEQLYRLSTFYPVMALLLGVRALQRRPAAAAGATALRQ
jgi:fucose permease